MREMVVDGVRVFHVEGPAKTTAGLLFGVGLRDEGFDAVGVTHLIEHLAMSTLPKSHLDSNASVTVDHTVFHASGRPLEVGAFLEGVCRALGGLPVDRLQQEVGVLLAEDCAGADLTVAAAWAARFGMDGPGMVVTRGAGPDALTSEQVLAHARRWFVTGNAAVAVVGPMPEGLRLPLPVGDRPQRSVPVAREQDGPQWVQAPCAGVGVLLDRPDPLDPAAVVSVDVLVERLKDVARTRHGLSYSVDLDVVDVGEGAVAAVVLDAREGRVSEVAGLLWQELGDLAERGPSPEELQHVVEGLAHESDLDDPDVAEGEAPRAAFGAVMGHELRPLEVLVAGWRSVTAEQVASTLARARAGALVVVPPDERLPEGASGITERTWCRTDTPLPSGRTFRPPALTRLFVRAARLQLVVGAESLGLRDADGDEHVIAWDAVAGLVPGEEQEEFTVVGRNLCAIHLHPDVFGREAFEAVRQRLADHGHRRPVPAPQGLPAPAAVDR